MQGKLTKLDWLQAGFRALTEQGPQALKAEPLAKSIGVSKGSFYWHFKDIPDFKSAMIQHWKQAATADVIAQIEAGSSNPTEKILALAHHSTALPRAEYGGPASESAIRDWARFEPDIAKIMAEIDAKRLAFTASLFEAAGQEKSQASQSARLLYSALIGLQILAPAKLAAPQKELAALAALLLTQPSAG